MDYWLSKCSCGLVSIKEIKSHIYFTTNGEHQIQVENFSEEKIGREKLSITILKDKLA